MPLYLILRLKHTTKIRKSDQALYEGSDGVLRFQLLDARSVVCCFRNMWTKIVIKAAIQSGKIY